MYLNVPQTASLYAQVHGQDAVDTLSSVEHSHASNLRLAISAWLKGSVESGTSAKETTTKKTRLRAENMIQEIVANLSAQGILHRSILDALEAADSSSSPSWFEARHPFSMPFPLLQCNQERTVIFQSGYTRYGQPIVGDMQIQMPASLNHFPSAHEGQLGVSGHEALLFRSLNGSPYLYHVFGAIFRAADSYQINPYAIRF